jgi:hypothetical protein
LCAGRYFLMVVQQGRKGPTCLLLNRNMDIFLFDGSTELAKSVERRNTSPCILLINFVLDRDP